MDVNNADPAFGVEKELKVQDVEPSIESPSEKASVVNAGGKPGDDFPEGGLRAWMVVAGASGVLFCGFGYANAFGYDNLTLCDINTN